MGALPVDGARSTGAERRPSGRPGGSLLGREELEELRLLTGPKPSDSAAFGYTDVVQELASTDLADAGHRFKQGAYADLACDRVRTVEDLVKGDLACLEGVQQFTAFLAGGDGLLQCLGTGIGGEARQDGASGR